MLRTIIWQLACQDEDDLAVVYDTCCREPDLALSRTRTAELAGNLLRSHRRSYVVVDGLDECDEKDAMDLIAWFGGLMQPLQPSFDNNFTVKLLISSRREPHITRMLAQHPCISLEGLGSHRSEIRRYIHQQTRRIQEKFHLEDALVAHMAAEVDSRTNGTVPNGDSYPQRSNVILMCENCTLGMFLWARIVLDSLHRQATRHGLMKELKALPEGLAAV